MLPSPKIFKSHHPSNALKVLKILFSLYKFGSTRKFAVLEHMEQCILKRRIKTSHWNCEALQITFINFPRDLGASRELSAITVLQLVNAVFIILLILVKVLMKLVFLYQSNNSFPTVWMQIQWHKISRVLSNFQWSYGQSVHVIKYSQLCYECRGLVGWNKLVCLSICLSFAWHLCTSSGNVRMIGHFEYPCCWACSVFDIQLGLSSP